MRPHIALAQPDASSPEGPGPAEPRGSVWSRLAEAVRPEARARARLDALGLHDEAERVFEAGRRTTAGRRAA